MLFLLALGSLPFCHLMFSLFFVLSLGWYCGLGLIVSIHIITRIMCKSLIPSLHYRHHAIIILVCDNRVLGEGLKLLLTNGRMFELNQLLFEHDRAQVADSQEKLCRLVRDFIERQKKKFE